MMIINIEKATNKVVDIGQRYDTRYYDNAQYPDGTIPQGANIRYYYRLGNGSIAALTQAQIEALSEDALRARLKSEADVLIDQITTNLQALATAIGALPDGPQKTILTAIRDLIVESLQLLRKVTVFLRLE